MWVCTRKYLFPKNLGGQNTMFDPPGKPTGGSFDPPKPPVPAPLYLAVLFVHVGNLFWWNVKYKTIAVLNSSIEFLVCYTRWSSNVHCLLQCCTECCCNVFRFWCKIKTWFAFLLSLLPVTWHLIGLCHFVLGLRILHSWLQSGKKSRDESKYFFIILWRFV